MSENKNEGLGFAITSFIIVGLAIAYAIACAIYYSKLVNGTSGSLSKTEATTLMWVSIVATLLLAAIWIWQIYNFFHGSGVEEEGEGETVNLARREYTAARPMQREQQLLRGVPREEYTAVAPGVISLSPGQQLCVSSPAPPPSMLSSVGSYRGRSLPPNDGEGTRVIDLPRVGGAGGAAMESGRRTF